MNTSVIRENEQIECPWDITRYWQGSIENTGNSALSSVDLTLPVVSRAVRIERLGHDAQFQESVSVIKVGDMRPKEEIKLYGWTHYRLDRDECSKINLVHSNGIGKVGRLETLTSKQSVVRYLWWSLLILYLLYLMKGAMELFSAR